MTFKSTELIPVTDAGIALRRMSHEERLPKYVKNHSPKGDDIPETWKNAIMEIAKLDHCN